MLGKVIFIVLLAIAVQHFIRVLMTFDFHRSVPYRHSPGPCQQVMRENGSEDLTILSNGMALITSNLYEEEGQVKLIDLSDPTAKVEDVNIDGGADINDFMVKPHGLSTWTDDKTGDVTVAVITHPDISGDRVEMFSFNPSNRVLKHLYSISDPVLFNLNDLVLVDRNCFYATKTHRLRRNWRNLETLLFLRLGEILYYDGKTVRTVATGLSFPNGINISPTMSVYLDSHIDNIEVDPGTGDLWIGSHYILHEIVSVLSAFESNKDGARHLIAPSQVFKLRTENGLITDAVEVYLNNGTEITGSSVAGVYGNKMIIGSIASQALVCDLIYVD